MSVHYLPLIIYLLCSLMKYSDAFCVYENSTCVDICKRDSPITGYNIGTFPWDIVYDDWQ